MTLLVQRVQGDPLETLMAHPVGTDFELSGSSSLPVMNRTSRCRSSTGAMLGTIRRRRQGSDS